MSLLWMTLEHGFGHCEKSRRRKTMPLSCLGPTKVCTRCWVTPAASPTCGCALLLVPWLWNLEEMLFPLRALEYLPTNPSIQQLFPFPQLFNILFLVIFLDNLELNNVTTKNVNKTRVCLWMFASMKFSQPSKSLGRCSPSPAKLILL